MSDDEREVSEEEEEEEEEEEAGDDEEAKKAAEEEKRKEEEKKLKKAPPPIIEKPEVQKTEAELAIEEKLRKKQEGDEDQWREYIENWRRQRAKEEDDLKKLKEKQAKRREQRENDERKYTEQKRREEEQRQRQMEEKKLSEQAEKLRRLQDAEKKRQAMQKAMETQKAESKPNFVITKRSDAGPGASIGTSAADRLLNVAAARGELGKTKEQLLEDKKISLSFRITELEIEGLSVDQLKEKAKELWESIIKLETDKYDLEERQKRQDYDLKELNERQRQINRNKALKKGLDPEALQGKHPPKIQVASKFERRVDRRSYGDKKGLFEGGSEATVMATTENLWMQRMQAFEERKGRLPKWLGEQPGKKKGDPDIPDEPEKEPEPVHVYSEEEEEAEEEEEEEEEEE